MKKPLIVLSLSVLSLLPSTSCSSASNEFITLTINPMVGYFYQSTSMGQKPQVFLIEKGSRFKDLQSIPQAILPLDGSPTTGISCYTYTDGTNFVGGNYQFNNDTTIYAQYFPSVTEAHTAAIGAVSYNVDDACARQPEAIAKISEKSVLVNNYIQQTTHECGAVGMWKMGYSEFDAFARQPEAIDNIFTLSEIYFDAVLECNSDIRGYAIGRIGSSTMDAAARQPEIIKSKFTIAANTAIECIKDANVINYFAYANIGSAAMDAIARQPEAADGMIDAMDKIFKKLALADNSYKAVAIMRAGYECMDACGRQPEAISKILEAALKNIDDILNS